MIRLILDLLVVLIFFVLTIIFWPMLGIIGLFSKEKADIVALRLVQAVFKILLVISGVKLTVIGEENVPKDTAVLYIGNHKSNFDTIITYARVPGRTGYVSKDSLANIPVLTFWMKKLYCLFLNRSDIRQGLKTILTAIDQVKAGISMCIFPEGGRNKTDEPTIEFHEGSFKVASKTGCPIIPMAISNSEHIMETQSPFIRSAHVVLQYGKPIIIDELSAEDKKFVGRYTRNVINEMLEENKKYL